MKRFKFVLISIMFFVCGSACSAKATDNFPVINGTTWVYSYETYKKSATDSENMLRGTYQLTDAIVDQRTISSVIVLTIMRENVLISGDDDTSQSSSTYWYIVDDEKVFRQVEFFDENKIGTNQMMLDYTFPLSLNRTWCLENEKCQFSGRREVVAQGSYETSLRKFVDCQKILTYYELGNITEWFCKNVGIVSESYDRLDGSYGFTRTLIDYSLGTP